jgi:hypothetical protein
MELPELENFGIKYGWKGLELGNNFPCLKSPDSERILNENSKKI